MLYTSVAGLLVGLMGIWSCAAAPTDALLPPTCTRVEEGATKTHHCFTATAFTTPIACPKYECPAQTDLVCPMIIRVTSVEVPCSTDCCPVTPTHTVTTPCGHCPTGCVIPTETITKTTGCAPTQTAAVTLTPGRL